MNTTYICYHFPPGLVPLSVVGPLLFLLQHALSCCAILQGKFTQDPTKAMNADLTYCVYRMAQEQQKGMKPTRVEKCHRNRFEKVTKVRINLQKCDNRNLWRNAFSFTC